MNHRTCDRCGQELLKDREVRYEVCIEVQAAYDPLNLSEDDLATDFQAEIAKVLQQLENVSLAEAQNQVHRKFEFDLCPGCQREFVRDPLATRIGKPPK
jgi:hypothetical protein